MERIDETERKTLNGVIAVYSDTALFHDVKDGEVSAGKYLTAETLSKLFKFLNGNMDFTTYNFKGIVPDNVIKYSTENGDIMFYTRPQRRMLIFDNDLGMETCEYNLPYLIWKFKNNSLSIFACLTVPNKETTKVFQAPFLNVSGSGNVCMGNTKFKDGSGDFERLMEHIQDQFFNSVFTHTNTNNLVNGDIFSIYKKAKEKTFVWKDELVKYDYTLKKLL